MEVLRMNTNLLSRASRLAMGLALALGATLASAVPVAPSAPAPDFTLRTMDGKNVRLQELRGRVVLVNFWATWCPPCREEMPSLTQLAKSYDPASLEVVAVSVDDGWAPVDQFLATPSTPFRVALDDGAHVSRAWGTSKFPETYLVDRDGRVRLKFVGPRNWTDPNVAVLLQSYGARKKS
jgi:thiol-disulfide isomerase/thioredoxin